MFDFWSNPKAMDVIWNRVNNEGRGSKKMRKVRTFSDKLNS